MNVQPSDPAKSATSALENMKELHEWLSIWEKNVNFEKRTRTNNEDSGQNSTMEGGSRRRVKLPKTKNTNGV